MAAGIKSLVKDTAIYGLSSIIGRFLNWCLTPLYVYIFTNPSEYGKVTYIQGIVALCMVLLTYGMETGFFRFMNKKDENPDKVYSSILTSLGFTSLLFTVGCFLFITPISQWMKYTDHPEHILIMAVTVAMDAFMVVPFAYLRYKKRPIRFVTLKIAFIAINIFLNIFFLVLCPRLYETNSSLINWFYNPDIGIGYIFIANLLANIILLILLIPYFTSVRYSFDKALLIRIYKYSFPLLILGIAGVINQTIAQLVYPHIFSDLDEAYRMLGIYNACLKITVVITMFIQAFRFAYEPFVFAKTGSQDNKQSYADAMKFFIVFALFVFLGVMFFMDILKYIVSENYMSGLSIVPIAMLGEIFFGIYFNLSIWYKLIDKTKYGATFSVLGCVITVLINVIFVPVYGIIASAWATFICNLIIMIISYIFGQKYYPIKYDLKSIFFYFGLVAVLYVLGIYVHIENEYLRLSYRSLLLLFFVFVLIKRDLPLSQIPVLNKLLKQKNDEINFKNRK